MSTSAPLQPISSRGIAVEAAHMIREAIMNGTFHPGDTLREGSLAESLKVSRGSVRQGLAILEREGIIRTGWHRPASVVPATRVRGEDLYRLRAGLDRIAAQGAAGAARDSDFTEALMALDEAVTQGAGQSDLVRIDLEFHDVVYRIADNGPLSDAWRAIRSQVRLYQLLRATAPEPGYAQSLLAEHTQYAQVLVNGDLDEVGRFAEQHVASALNGLLKRLEN